MDREKAVEHKNLGNEYANTGEWNLAIEQYEMAQKCDETYAIAWLNCGRARNEIGDYDGAIADFDKVFTCDPPDAEAYYYLGVVYKDGKNDPEKAIENFEMAVEHDPDHRATAFSCLGEEYQKKGDFEKAEENYKKAIEEFEERFENVAGVYYNLGILYFKVGRFVDAIRALSMAIGHDPKDADAYYGRGLAYDAGSRECATGGSAWLSTLQKAKDDFQKVTALAPNRVKAHVNLGLAHLSLHDLGPHEFNEAITAFNKAIDLDENNAYVYYLRGMAYNNKGDFERINRNYSDARNNYDKATRDYNKALSIDPDIREAQDALAEVGNKRISLPGIGS